MRLHTYGTLGMYVWSYRKQKIINNYTYIRKNQTPYDINVNQKNLINI